MKHLGILLCFAMAATLPSLGLANTERVSADEDANPEIKPMGFDQCVDLQRDYEQEYGSPEIVLESPALRIVKFSSKTEQEQIACDGDAHTVTLLNFEDGD